MNFLLRGAALNRRSEYDVARHCMPSGRGEARCPISGTNIPHGTVPRGTVAGNQQYHPSPAGSAPGRGMPACTPTAYNAELLIWPFWRCPVPASSLSLCPKSRPHLSAEIVRQGPANDRRIWPAGPPRALLAGWWLHQSSIEQISKHLDRLLDTFANRHILHRTKKPVEP